MSAFSKIAMTAFLGVLAGPIFAMGAQVSELRLSYDAEAYRAWPVFFGLQINGAPDAAPQTVRCCIERGAAPGSGSVTSTSILYEGDPPKIAFDVIWAEVHSDRTYQASVDFSVEEIAGWTKGNVNAVLSFRPGGELVVYVDGPELAERRSDPDQKLDTGKDLGEFLTAPLLGRALERSDYFVVRQVCGTLDNDPPELFSSGRAAFSEPVLAEIDADKTRPLPSSTCENAQ